MWIKRVALRNFRNFTYFSADLAPDVTLLYGNNGTGKTSIMEAIALFGLGRSFRSAKIAGLNKIGQKQPFQIALTVQEDLQDSPAAVLDTCGTPACAEDRCVWVEDAGSPHRLHFRDENGTLGAAEVIHRLPLQLLYANSFSILEAGSAHRRQLLDWGSFFVMPGFAGSWRRYARILKQRNALLRTHGAAFGQHQSLWDVWDNAFLDAAQAVEALRSQYWTLFEPIFLEIIPQFLPGWAWTLQYSPGWPVGETLLTALQGRFRRDCALGYTSMGPHRADFEIYLDGFPAKHLLSRGQTKLLICALLVARARLLFRETGRSCVLLIDDVDAELDVEAMERLFEGLKGLPVQWIATSLRQEGPWAHRAINCRIPLSPWQAT